MDGVDETIFGEKRKTENRTFSANFEEVVHLRVITGDEGWQSGDVNHRPDVWLLPGDGAGPKFLSLCWLIGAWVMVGRISSSIKPIEAWAGRLIIGQSLSLGWVYIKFN